MGNHLYREVIAYLKEHGCYFVRQAKGSHEIWFSPVNKRKFPVAYTIVKPEMANAICKHAGLPKHF